MTLLMLLKSSVSVGSRAVVTKMHLVAATCSRNEQHIPQAPEAESLR